MPAISEARQLREKRAEIGATMGEITSLAFKEDRSLTDDERTKFDAMNTQVDELAQRVADAERAEELGRDLDKPAGNDGEFRLDDGRTVTKPPADREKVITERDEDYAFRAWGLRENAPEKFRQAADKLAFAASRSETTFKLADSREYEEIRRQFRNEGLVYRATTFQSVGTDAAGGYTVPTRLSNTLEEAMLYFGGMLEAAELMRTSDGADLGLPTADDTASFAAIVAENNAQTVGNLAFGQVTLRAHMYSSKIVRSSFQLLQDTAIDLTGYIGRALGTRLARGLNRDFTTGSTATTSPRGIIRDSAVGFSATTTSGDISLTSLTELYHSVDKEYRDEPGAGFMMHDGIVKEARLVVDSNGQPLWGQGLRAGEPDTLLGKPVFVNNRLTASSTGSGATLALFGALRKYINRQARDVQLFRLDERYAELLQVGWFAILRADGRLLVSSTRTASKPVKHLVGTT